MYNTNITVIFSILNKFVLFNNILKFPNNQPIFLKVKAQKDRQKIFPLSDFFYDENTVNTSISQQKNNYQNQSIKKNIITGHALKEKKMLNFITSFL